MEDQRPFPPLPATGVGTASAAILPQAIASKMPRRAVWSPRVSTMPNKLLLPGWKLGALITLGVVGLVWVAVLFLQPPPTRRIVMATGPCGNA